MQLLIISQIDNSKPTSGAFAIETPHAVDHILQTSRNSNNFMSYSKVVEEQVSQVLNATTGELEDMIITAHVPAIIRLSWIGFQDPHSRIDYYIVTIGRSYRGTEMHQVHFTKDYL